MEATIERVWIEVVADQDPDTSYLEQEGLDFEDRLGAYQRGEFYFVGVRARAELRFKTEQGGWIYGPTVTTPGLWGIESDSGDDYFRTVGEDEAAELEEMLKALGIEHTRANYARRMAATELRWS